MFVNTVRDRVLLNVDVCDFLLSHCTPASVFQYGCVSQATHILTKSYVRRNFDISRHLSRFFVDAEGFRVVQAKTGTLISGSNALQFFARTCYVEADMDLYVPRGRETHVGKFLLGEGYKFVATKRQQKDFLSQDAQVYLRDARPEEIPTPELRPVADDDDDADDADYRPLMQSWGVFLIYTFVKSLDNGQERKVQLLIAHRSPIHCVLKFHSTCVMNVIAWDAAYSLYPRATFEDRLSLVTPRDHSDESWSKDAIGKYEARGWTFVKSFAKGSRAFPTGSRWITGKDSWTLSLSPLTADHGCHSPTPSSKPLMQDPVVATNWSLLKPSDPFLAYRLFSGPHLHYDYVLTDLELFGHLRETMWRQQFTEYTKAKGSRGLSPQQRFQIRECLDAQLLENCQGYRERMEEEKRSPTVYQAAHAYIDTKAQEDFTWGSCLGSWDEERATQAWIPRDGQFKVDFDSFKKHAVKHMNTDQYL